MAKGFKFVMSTTEIGGEKIEVLQTTRVEYERQFRVKVNDKLNVIVTPKPKKLRIDHKFIERYFPRDEKELDSLLMFIKRRHYDANRRSGLKRERPLAMS